MSGHPTVDAEPPAVSRDLVKSRALSKKKRSEVADGTAESSRAQRIKDQLDQLDQLGQLDGSLNFTPIEFPDAVEHDVKTLLDIIAKTRGQVPLSDNFYNRLEDSTEEWLRRFTLDPYTTSPSHPALKYCAPSHPALKYYASTDSGAKTGEEEDGASEKDGEDDATSEKDGDGDDTSGKDGEGDGKEKVFKVYIRTYETTAKEERARLQAFMEQHPHFAASVRAKLDSLEKHSDDTTVWGHYIGQTMSDLGPVGRHESDMERALSQSGTMTTLLRWIAFTHPVANPPVTYPSVVWKIYEFRAFRTSLGTSLGGSDGDIWRSRADLQELEYGLTVAADKRGWNSAPGGLPQTAYVVGPQLTEILQANVSPVLLADSASTFSPPSALVRKHFKENYQMAPARLNRTVSDFGSFVR
jgi:hypothetical protein